MSSVDQHEISLRPYKIKSEFDLNYPLSYKPQIGIVDNNSNESISLSLPFIGQADSSNGQTSTHYVARKMMKPLVTKPSLSYKKNIYSDLEFKEYFDLSNLRQLAVSLVNSFTSNYFKLLIGQPFEVSTLVLQVGSFKRQHEPGLKSLGVSKKSGQSSLVAESDDDDDDVNYFATDSIDSPSRLRQSHIERSNARLRSSRKSSFTSPPNKSQLSASTQQQQQSFKIQPVSLNQFDIISSLISKEGPRGVLKAVNTSFLMNTLQYTIESWVTGFISGLLGIPDPLFVELIHSPNANLSLGLSVTSNVVTSLILSQISLIRLKFIVTNSSKGVRSFREIVWKLPRFFIITPPKLLVIPNIITSLVKSLCHNYPNYLLLSTLQLNKYNSPVLYNSFLLLFKILGLFIRLPFETLYNRAQLNYLLTSKDLPEAMKLTKEDLCVEFGGYYGYLSTLYYVFMGAKPIDYGNDNSFKENITLDIEDEEELNQGYAALFRGWKVGLLRVVSRFALNLLNQDEALSGVTEEKF